MFIVFMERAQRRIIVQYPKRQVGMKVFAGESSHLPLKLNSSGVFSIMFASMLLALPMTLVGFSGQAGTGFVGDLIRILQHGQPLYMLIYATLIVFFAFFFTSVMSNPQETAENLRKQHGFVPGLRPGLATENHIRQVLNRITVVGSAYLIVVALLPEMLIAHYSIPFYFGGTGLLIVVTVTLDTVAQVHSHLVAHQYEGLLRKSRLKGSKKK
jgi:preprotein translocase subunit SecY